MARLKILCPVDFSENCRHALAFTIEFVQNREAEIFLFYVVEESRRMHFRGAADKLEEDLERMKDLMVNELNIYQQRTGRQASVGEVHRRIANGKPWEEILRMSGNITSDIIVMGASRKGKNAMKVVEMAPCTTIIVREKDMEFVMAD
ncbi:MAG: universal stress protein [Deltaproteobacteria bacterium]|nr:universal stress protein [Deltaproteobacteria bacterium]